LSQVNPLTHQMNYPLAHRWLGWMDEVRIAGSLRVHPT
jgi:hypothetical protein